MKIAVCDDEEMLREDIFGLIKKQIPEAEVFCFCSGEEMLETGYDFAISFIDIAMGEMSGIETAWKIRERQEREGKQKSILIFVTGFQEYMGDAFDVNAYHYLMKPIDRKKFESVLGRAWKEASMAQEQEVRYIMVKVEGIQQKIFLRDIYYIESGNKKFILHTKEKNMESYGRMEELEEMLEAQFYRCHRCFLVNLEYISAYSADRIQLTNGDVLLMAKRKYAEFVKRYLRYAKNGGIVHV